MSIDLNMSVSDLKKLSREELEELYHHGVKGQKWGVRRSDKQLAAARSTALTEAKSLSDSELRAKISRIQMEKQYVDLVAPLPKTSNSSSKFVKELLADTGKSIAKEQTKKYATKGVEMVASGILEKTTGVRAPKTRR